MNCWDLNQFDDQERYIEVLKTLTQWIVGIWTSLMISKGRLRCFLLVECEDDTDWIDCWAMMEEEGVITQMGHWWTHTHNRFMALFPGPSGWAGARRELLDFMVQGKINRGRHTDHRAGRHSIRTNQCPPPLSPHIFLRSGCPSCRPTNSIKALKATSAFGLGRRR